MSESKNEQPGKSETEELTQQLDTDDLLLKRLQSLQRPTWELELLISGAVVFSLFQLPGRLKSWLDALNPHVGSDVGMMPFMVFYCLTLLVICLAVAFSAHFVLRSVWVGLCGLRSVFPKGIEWDRLDIGPIARKVAREMNPDLRIAEERIDRIASSVFAVLFAIVVSFIGSFILILVPMLIVETVRARVMPDVPALVTMYALLLLICVPVLSVGFIDGWFKKDLSRVQRHPKLFDRSARFSKLMSKLMLSTFTSPVTLTLSSRWSWKKVSAALGLSIFLAVALFLAYFVATLGIFGFDSYVFYPRDSGATVLNPAHYENQRRPGDSSRLPTIPSEVAEGELLRLFVPFVVNRDGDRVTTTCPDLEAPRAEGFFLRLRTRPDDEDRNSELLRCVGAIYLVMVDQQELLVDWTFATHPTNDLKGVVGYLPIGTLEAGRHELFVARWPSEDEITVTVEMASANLRSSSVSGENRMGTEEERETPSERQPGNRSADTVEGSLDADSGEEVLVPSATSVGDVDRNEANAVEVASRDRSTIVFWKSK